MAIEAENRRRNRARGRGPTLGQQEKVNVQFRSDLSYGMAISRGEKAALQWITAASSVRDVLRCR